MDAVGEKLRGPVSVARGVLFLIGQQLGIVVHGPLALYVAPHFTALAVTQRRIEIEDGAQLTARHVTEKTILHRVRHILLAAQRNALPLAPAGSEIVTILTIQIVEPDRTLPGRITSGHLIVVLDVDDLAQQGHKDKERHKNEGNAHQKLGHRLAALARPLTTTQGHSLGANTTTRHNYLEKPTRQSPLDHHRVRQ